VLLARLRNYEVRGQRSTKGIRKSFKFLSDEVREVLLDLKLNVLERRRG
jgi:hypothetical protein